MRPPAPGWRAPRLGAKAITRPPGPRRTERSWVLAVRRLGGRRRTAWIRYRLRSLMRAAALLGHDLGAELNTLVADRDRRRRTANDRFDVGVHLAAKRASKTGAIDGCSCRLGILSVLGSLVGHARDTSPRRPAHGWLSLRRLRLAPRVVGGPDSFPSGTLSIGKRMGHARRGAGAGRPSSASRSYRPNSLATPLAIAGVL